MLAVATWTADVDGLRATMARMEKRKRCARCKDSFPLDQMLWRNGKPSTVCLGCDRARKNESVRRHRANLRALGLPREHYRSRAKAYAALLLKQPERCLICDAEPAEPGGLVVDHCHQTGALRGLLCNGCNLALGHFKDDTARIRNAVLYLEGTL